VNIRDDGHFKLGDHLIKMWHDKIGCRVLGAKRSVLRKAHKECDVFVFLSAPPSSAVLTDAKGVEVFFYLLSENEIFLQVQVVCGGW
jgi:hypothetical protein